MLSYRLVATELLMIGILGCGGAEEQHRTQVERLRSSIIEGSASVEELDFPISPLQQDAIIDMEWCTATIIGDRVAVLAGHCVVQNNQGWFYEGEDPVVVSPWLLTFVVGSNIDEPKCILHPDTIHLNPSIEPDVENLRTHQDIAVVVFQESVFELCPDTVPIQLNRDPIEEDLIGAHALVGGYGSLDGSRDFSTIRYWALLEFTTIRDDDIVLSHVYHGFPTNGDSGAPALLWYPDSSLRILGVVSGGEGVGIPGMRFIRTDAHVSFLEEVVNEGLVCGPISSSGECRGDTVIRCDDGWLLTTDCSQHGQGFSCSIEDERATCHCSCDEEPYCDADCECDPDCECACNTSARCDDACECDLDCDETPSDAGVDGGDASSDAADAEADGDQPRGTGAGGCTVLEGHSPAHRAHFSALLSL